MKSPFAGNRRGWKIYCIAVALALVVIYTVVLTAAFRPLHLVDLALTLSSFAGLYGYAFRQRVLWAGFWRIQCFLFPAWEVAMNFYFSQNTVRISGFVALFALMLFFVPEYWALWKYGYRSPEIWGMESSH